MAKVRFAATVGAAAFLAGASLAVPQSIAIAMADRTNSSSSSDASSADASASTSEGTDSRPARAALPGPRGGAGHNSAPTARAAAAQRSSAQAANTPSRPSPAAGRTRPAPDSAPATTPAESAQPAAGAAVGISSSATAMTEPAPVSSPASSPLAPAAPVVAAAAAPAPAVVAAPPAPAHAGTVAAVSASATANATGSTAALIDKLLAPISRLFGEGTALLIRRNLFNQAPSVAPVQLTGQLTGPITGTIGAFDPEGDPLSYRITGTPVYGSAVVNNDGTYTYTPATSFPGADTFVVSVSDGGKHINLLDPSRPASTTATVGVAQGALAPMLRFQFIYGSGSQYWSPAARSSLESAANRLASYIVVSSPVTVTFDVTGEKSALSSTLASAGSDFVTGDKGFLQTVVQNKILTGVDSNGSAADGTIDWNFGPSWGFTSVTSNQYDMQSIAMHEMLHTLGFMSNMDKAGSNTGKVWTVFDNYVVNSAGTPVINSTTYVFNTAFNTNLTGGSDGMYFGGPHAVAANGGPVRLYTPMPWESGSSMSHVAANYLMKAVINSGPGFRDISDVELGILSDIGYTVTPGSGTLLFVGFVTLRVRRRRD